MSDDPEGTDAATRLGAMLRHEPRIFSRQEEADLRAVLDEREQLAAEAVELRAIRDSRVREVRAAHAAGWLDHAEYVAERNRSGFTARETAGQAYTAARIADWHKTEPEATHG
jgi:hypothetical protein